MKSLLDVKIKGKQKGKVNRLHKHEKLLQLKKNLKIKSIWDQRFSSAVQAPGWRAQGHEFEPQYQ